MIYDSISNIATYQGLEPCIVEGLQLLQTVDFDKLEDGHYEVKDGLYYNIMSYDTAPGGRLEAHDLYADIQFVTRGEEFMGISARERLGAPVENPDGDVVFFEGVPESMIKLSAGSFIVIYPQDAHAPGYSMIEGPTIKRVCMKVKLG